MHWTEEELRAHDSKLQTLTAADLILIRIFGDTIHQNDGTHLHGGAGSAVDAMWQRRWKALIAGPHRFYELPRGKVAHRFLALLIAEWKGCREGRWNSERPLCLAACILHRLNGMKMKACEIRAILTQRMDVWEAGRFDTLVTSVENQWKRGDGNSGQRVDLTEEEWLESKGRRFNALVQSGKLRNAVRTVTDRNGGGLYRPTDACSKTGEPVLEVLR